MIIWCLVIVRDLVDPLVCFIFAFVPQSQKQILLYCVTRLNKVVGSYIVMESLSEGAASADSSSKDGALMYLLLSTKGKTQIIGQVKICGENSKNLEE